MVSRFFRWVRRVWQKVNSWVFFWRHKPESMLLDRSSSKKLALKKTEQTPPELSTSRLVETPSLNACAKVLEPRALSTTTEQSRGVREHRSLMRLSRTAVQSVSTLMLSTLQSGWQMCRWKSVSSSSITSQMRVRSPLDTPEAEMLREVYLVLWAIRKQLRQLSRRQERRRRHHIRTHTSPPTDPVPGLKQDAQSPL
ncbi:sperm acrosome developmental regulator [Thomomys bottae]